MMRRAKLRQLSLALAASVLFQTVPAFAACTNPAGNEGDINYGGTQHLMVYCNGTSWISMGQSTSFGTLTTNDFCTATSSTGIQCTTGYTGNGSVVLATSPSLSSPSMTSPTVSSGGLSITAGGLTVLAGGASITGTVTGTTFSGSGASLMGIGTSNMTAVTGTPSATTFLAGNGTWATPAAVLPALTNNYLWIGNASNVATAVQVSGDCTIANTGSITCTKTGGTLFGTLATASAAPAGTLTGSTLASNVTASSLTSVGTITSGVWNGTGIAIGYGGTNATSQTTNGVNYFNGTSITSGTGFVYSGGQVGIGTALPAAAIDVNGNIDIFGSNGYLVEIANAGTTGTTANKLAKLTGAPSTVTIGTTGDTGGIIGVVAGQAGTSGNAQIAVHGQANCIFENATTAGDYVQIGTSTAGDCHDAGSAYPASGQVIGRVLTSGAAGTRAVELFGPEIKAGSGLLGGSTNYDAIWTSPTTIGTGLIYESGGLVGIGTNNPQGIALNIMRNGGTLGTELLELDSNDTWGSGFNLNNNSPGGHKWQFYSYGSSATGQTGNFALIDDTATGGPTRMTFTTSGNVGIGTESPVSLLNLAQTSTAVGTTGMVFYPTAGVYDNPTALAQVTASPTADTSYYTANSAISGWTDVPASNVHSVLNPIGVHGIVTTESTTANNGTGNYGAIGAVGETTNSGTLGSLIGTGGYAESNSGSVNYMTAGDFWAGLYGGTASPAGVTASADQYGGTSSYIDGVGGYPYMSVGTTGDITGLNTWTQLDSGTVSDGVWGVNANVIQNGGNIAWNLTGGGFYPGLNGGTANALSIVDAEGGVSGGTLNGDLVGVNIWTYFTSGTVTGNKYGLYINDDGNVTGGGNNWAIYQANSAQKNFFAGPLSLGGGLSNAKFLVYEGDGLSVGDADGITQQGNEMRLFGDNGGGYATNMTFGFLSTTGTFQERMRLTGTGNVGIGNTNPSDPLDINKNQNAVTQIQVTNATLGASAASALNLNTSSTWFEMWLNDYNANPVGLIQLGQGDFYIETLSANMMHFQTNSADRLVINGSGSVGIGTAAPQATLDVNGYMKLAAQTSAPLTCASGVKGTIAMTTNNGFCFCNGSAWRKVESPTTACAW